MDMLEKTELGVPSYGSPRQYGDRYLRDLLADRYVVQEKIDGSQFSFGRLNGEVLFRSSRHQLKLETCPKDFRATIEHLTDRAYLIPEGLIFRGEAMTRGRHNKLNYLRVPDGNLVLYDIERGGRYIQVPAVEACDDKEAQEAYQFWLVGESLPYEELVAWAEKLGVTPVQQLWVGEPGEPFDLERVTAFLNSESQLGGTPEGVVVKNPARRDHGKVMMGKIVGSHFKEVKAVVRERGPSQVADIIAAYRTEARWDKAIQHLREEGKLDGTMRDVPALLREVHQDIESEETENLKALLWKTFRKEILKGAADGLPQHYQKTLAEGLAS